MQTQYETQIKSYISTKDYQRDADKLARQGWEATNSSWRSAKPGCMRILLTGGLGLIFFRPKDELTVTYRRPME